LFIVGSVWRTGGLWFYLHLFLENVMSQMIESMESRILLSASVAVIKQDLKNLAAERSVAKADLTSALAQFKADVATVKADVIAVHPTSAQKAALTKLETAGTLQSSKYKLKITTILTHGSTAATNLATALTNLENHPTSSTILANAEKDLTALQNVFSTTAVTAVESSAATTVVTLDTDFTGVGAVVPTALSDVNTAEGHLQGDLTTLSTVASTIQTDIAKLADDLDFA
jgi:hypothetical protein